MVVADARADGADDLAEPAAMKAQLAGSSPPVPIDGHL
jgi:hypothetical protein